MRAVVLRAPLHLVPTPGGGFAQVSACQCHHLARAGGVGAVVVAHDGGCGARRRRQLVVACCLPEPDRAWAGSAREVTLEEIMIGIGSEMVGILDCTAPMEEEQQKALLLRQEISLLVDKVKEASEHHHRLKPEVQVKMSMDLMDKLREVATCYKGLFMSDSKQHHRYLRQVVHQWGSSKLLEEFKLKPYQLPQSTGEKACIMSVLIVMRNVRSGVQAYSEKKKHAGEDDGSEK